MASINDLATAATIASSAPAQQGDDREKDQDQGQTQGQSSPDAASGPRPDQARQPPSPPTSTPPATAPVEPAVPSAAAATSPATGPPPATQTSPSTVQDAAALLTQASPSVSATPATPADPRAPTTSSPTTAQAMAPGHPNMPAPEAFAEAAAAAAAATRAARAASASMGPPPGARHTSAAVDTMEGIEKTAAAAFAASLQAAGPARGAFVVFEGMDRAGKTTQAKLLQQRCIESGRTVKFMRFPDRSTPIGQMIDSYLKGQAEIEDHVIHLLFSANRWEAINKIKQELACGHTIICDRFYHSGIVYSAAKQLPSLSLSWAKAPEVGLPRPDLVLFLDLEESVARRRGGWGGEVYEKGEMQRRVRELFWGLSMGDLRASIPGSSSSVSIRDDASEGQFKQEEEDIQIVDANLGVEELSERVWDHALPRIEAVERGEVGRSVRLVQ